MSFRALFISFVCLTLWTSSVHGTDIYESFDGWIKDGYANQSIYSNAASGVWVIDNAVCRADNARSGRAVRFNSTNTPTPYLEYRGLTGNGISGFISSISFYYRHWDADGNAVRFVLQTSPDALSWSNISEEQSAITTTYEQFIFTNGIEAQGLFLRIFSTAYNERLLIDDFAISWSSVPVLSLAPTTLSVSEAADTATIWAVVSPPGEGSADIVIAGGNAAQDEDFVLVTTTLVFSASTPSQAIHVLIVDDDDPEANETIILATSNLDGVIQAAGAAQSVITIVDDEMPSLCFDFASTSVVESAGTVSIPVMIGKASDATANIHLGGTAMEGTDYLISSTSLTFAADGPAVQYVDVEILDDGEGEPNETIGLEITHVIGANTMDPSTCVVTILDNEPRVWIEPAELMLCEGDDSVEFRVALSSPADATVRVAVTGADLCLEELSLSATTLVFTAASSATQTVSIAALPDGTAEGPEQGFILPAQIAGAFPDSNRTTRIRIRDSDSMLIMSANLTSGQTQVYRDPAQRLFQGLLPDVVAIQEFNVTNVSRRAFVDSHFGTNFSFMVEPVAGAIPNGIISRWPIVASGEWADPYVSNRDFAWATIDIPGPRMLHVVSAHLYASGTPGDRNAEAQILVQQIQSEFPPDDYIVVAGDLNTETRTEAAILTLTAVVSDGIQPADQLGNRNTNRGRTRPLDYVLPNSKLETWHTPLPAGGLVFTNGIVFDSRLWASPPYPIQTNDADALNMQHMPVAKLFAFATGLVMNAAFDFIAEIGNGNGLYETGEVLNVFFRVENDGSIPGSNISLSVQSESAGLLLPGGFEANFETLPPMSFVTNEIPCVIQIAENASSGDHVLRAIITANGLITTNELVIPVFINRIEEALDTTDMEWTFSGTWEYETNLTWDGEDSLRSDYIPANGVNWIQTVIEGPGELTYAWSMRSSSEPGYLRSVMDNSFYQYQFSSTWTMATNIIPPGVHTMRWAHINYSAAPTRSTGFIDRVVFTPFTQPVLSVSSPNVTQITYEGSPAAQRYLAIRNIGTDSLTFTAHVESAWLSLQIFNPVVSNDFNYGYILLTFDPSALAPGNYQETMIVSAPDATPSAITVGVHMVVLSPMDPGAGETNIVFYSYGNSPWFIQTAITHDGVSAAQSGRIAHNQESHMEADVIGPGTLSFLWKVSSERYYDYLVLFINDAWENDISGEVGWQRCEYVLPAGIHRIRWTYSKDGSVSNGLDAAWLDEIMMVGIPDRDADGIPDAWELRHFDSATGAVASADWDDDGFSNMEEFIADTNPKDDMSFFDGIRDMRIASPLTLELGQTSTGRVYDLLGTTNLVVPVWQSLHAPLDGTGSNLLIQVPSELPGLYMRSRVQIPSP